MGDRLVQEGTLYSSVVTLKELRNGIGKSKE